MQDSFHCGQRISVVGTTGSGKTTLAQRIAQQLQISHVELDALHWEPGWTEASDQVFRDRITEALAGDRWVVDGNYSKARDLVWSRADTVVFLDYPFWLVMNRLLQRTVQRSFRQEELWNGNRENVWLSFFSQNSILLWLLQTYQRNRKKYPALFQQPEYAHLSVIHLQSPKTTEDWLLNLSELATQPAVSPALEQLPVKQP
ncbi:AAA family ATPase [Leptolyngbya sp. FACHB-541]|uniref:AAA family ATPase n=1 Tax=Leptolyngbya sp. FACHB-541 TaxID=2692810 RepID=UPI0016895A97|nr:AAA family ATPase [Leptolyngbya sp. FACHB-541]MBD2001169.1 AAA family ATPase [Leptolyngbya sp. FACHB-541]